MITSTSTSPLTTYTDQTWYAYLTTIIQDKKIIFLCFVFSLFIHIVFLIQFGGLKNKYNAAIPISHSINIVLNKLVPDQAPQTQEEIKSVKRTTAAPAKRKSVVKEKAEDVVKEETIEHKQSIQSQPNNVPSDLMFLDSEKKQYLELVTAHLDKHKFYPRSARRRHIEGDVKISFDLMKDGNILNLKISSENSILHNATLESINSALPMPQRPENLMALNLINIEYTMQYAIK